MCRAAPEAVIELEHMGMPFDRVESGKIYQRPFGGHTAEHGKRAVERACAVADRTGHAMLHTLYQQNVRANTQFFVEWTAQDLIRDENGDVVGVTAMEMETGEVYIFHAKAVMFATGGGGRIYASSTNAYMNTGDGLGICARAGIPLEDMEFWQFHPTGVAGAGVLITEGVRGEGGILLNADGERFMERYAPTVKTWLLATWFHARWRWKSMKVAAVVKQRPRLTENRPYRCRKIMENCRASARFPFSLPVSIRLKTRFRLCRLPTI